MAHNRTMPNTRVAEAYRRLRHMILDNEMAPGFQGFEAEIADRLGMSRTPVREALVRLENEGLLQIRPRRGVFLAPLNADDMREIYQVLASLEVTAAELWANGNWPAREADLDLLDGATMDMDNALSRDDLESWARADDAFHTLLLEKCGNQRLYELAATLMDQSRRARKVTLRLRPKPTKSTDDHRALVQAIRDSDAVKAAALHRDHRLQGMDVLVNILRDYSIPGL